MAELEVSSAGLGWGEAWRKRINTGGYSYQATGFSRYIAVGILTLCLLSPCVTRAQIEKPRRVLVLNSYHPTFPWTRIVVESIESTLKQYESRIKPDIEYMDTKHFSDAEHYENLYVLYKHKARSKRYDIIITTDSDAFLFLLQHRDELYPHVPVVFCGIEESENQIVRNYKSMQQDYELVTGVLEIYEYEPTIEIALRFHPSAKQVVLLNASKKMESMHWDAMKKAIPRVDRALKLVSYSAAELTMEGFLKEIEELGDESIVLLTGRFYDSDGDLYTYEEDTALIQQHCRAPIYVLTETRLGFGPIGGKLKRGHNQGQIAAEMAMRILDGEDASNIPIVCESLNEFMFDYNQMQRFGISVSELPEGSIVVNEPKSFYYLYKRRIWTVLAVIVSLSAVILILSVNIVRRRRAEEVLAESEQQFRTIFDSATDGILLADVETKKFYAGNKMICQILGYSREEIKNLSVMDVHPKEDVPAVIKQFDKQVNKECSLAKDIPVMRKDGSVFYADVNAAVIKLAGERYLMGIFRDVTERKEAESKLLDYQRQLKSLASELSLTEERERHRIATELHDRISQSLVLFKVKLESLREFGPSAELTKALSEVSKLLDQIIQDTKLLTFDLSFPILYELGFEAAVSEWLVEHVQEKHGIATEFEDDERPKPLDDDIRVLLFRDVRELLINVVKHAQARKVKVSIQKIDSEVHVSVQDDGIGFDVEKVASVAVKKGGFGLFSIHEQLEQVGGHFEISSKPGRGTKIILIAPLKSGSQVSSKEY